MDATQHMSRILDAKYQKTNLSKITSDKKKSSSDEQGMTYSVLTKYELLFDRTLGIWKIKPVDIELHPG